MTHDRKGWNPYFLDMGLLPVGYLGRNEFVAAYHVRKGGKDFVLKRPAPPALDYPGMPSEDAQQALLHDVAIRSFVNGVHGVPAVEDVCNLEDRGCFISLSQYVEGVNWHPSEYQTHHRKQLLELVGQLHIRGVANLDLRERNILIEPLTGVWMTDFCSAIKYDEDPAGFERARHHDLATLERLLRQGS